MILSKQGIVVFVAVLLAAHLAVAREIPSDEAGRARFAPMAGVSAFADEPMHGTGYRLPPKTKTTMPSAAMTAGDRIPIDTNDLGTSRAHFFPENFKTNWADWAIRYGVGTNAEYEAAFLLNISPYTEIAPTSSPLKVVDFRSTSTGYRFELASDVCRLFQHDGDEGDTLLCNGALALEVATDLSALAQSHVSIPVPVVIDSTTGHAVIEMNISDYLNAYPYPLPSNIEFPSPLSAPPSRRSTPIRPHSSSSSSHRDAAVVLV